MVAFNIVVRPDTRNVHFKSDKEESEESTRDKDNYSDTESMYSVNMNMKALAGLIILKIIFVDIFTSVGDIVTDFLQGIFNSH